MRWQQGRPAIEDMLGRHELDRVPPSREHADRLLAQARRHLTSAQALTTSDPTGAYQLLYDAARKSLGALLENQGLRATSKGGHVAVIDAARAQLDPPLGGVLRPVDRMRRRRNDAEYPSQIRPELTPEEIERDVPKVAQVIDAVERVLGEMAPF